MRYLTIEDVELCVADVDKVLVPAVVLREELVVLSVEELEAASEVEEVEVLRELLDDDKEIAVSLIVEETDEVDEEVEETLDEVMEEVELPTAKEEVDVVEEESIVDEKLEEEEEAEDKEDESVEVAEETDDD